LIFVRDEDGPSEALKPKLTFNPHFQRLYQVGYKVIWTKN